MIEAKDLYKHALPSSDELKLIEAAIDEALIEQARSKGANSEFIIASKKFGNTTYVREHMMTRYRYAGYSVKYESDQRDGDFVRMKIIQMPTRAE